MNLIKNGDKYYLAKSGNNYYGIQGNYYTIVNGKLIWANPNIRLIRTGGSNDYILTNYIPNTNTVVKIIHGFDSAPEVMNERYTLLWNGGHYNSSTYPDAFYYSWWRASSNTNGYASWFYVGTSGGAQSYSLTMVAGHKYELIVSGSTSVNQKLTDLESGTVLQNYNNTWSFNGSLTNTLRIFSNNTNNTVKYYIYQTEIIENNTVLHQFVPVPKGLIIGDFIVPSNGMFDIVEQKFYENRGTGEFEIGGIPEDYIIEDGKMIWCNPNIYLESTGTQYIETNHYANGRTIIEGEFQLTDTATLQQRIFGCDASKTGLNYTMSIYINSSGKWAFTCKDDTGSWTATSVSKDANKHSYKLGFPCTYFYIDGNKTVSIPGTQNKIATKSLVVFASKRETGVIADYAKIKQFKFTIYENFLIKNHLVPIPKGMLIGDKIAPSNCMFDMVTQTFFENKGTGTFTYGKDN